MSFEYKGPAEFIVGDQINTSGGVATVTAPAVAHGPYMFKVQTDTGEITLQDAEFIVNAAPESGAPKVIETIKVPSINHHDRGQLVDQIVKIETRFGTFAVGDSVKGAKGVEMIIKGFANIGSVTEFELKAHLVSKENRNLAWRKALSLRHFA